MASPLEQFRIKPLIELPEIAGLQLHFTNSSLMLLLVLAGVIGFFSLAMRKKALLPGRFQLMAESMYQMVEGMLDSVVGKEGRRYLPFIFSIFMFVLFCNLLGMMPYSFTVTSHIVVTFALAMLVFIAVTLIALFRHGLHFFSFFLPAGTPWWLAPLMIVIELFAYLARPVSLSVRLAANMVAGHVLLKVLAGFVVALGPLKLGLPILVVAMPILSGFEVFVAVLQAYIFAILTCVYLNDAVHLH